MTDRPTLTVVSVQGPAGLPAGGLAHLQGVADVRVVARGDLPPLSHEEALEVLDGADVAALTPRVTPVVDDALLDALPRLSGIALHATGTDLYDLDLLTRRRVALAMLPEYSTVSVAEHAMAMLLSLSRRVHLANDRSRGLVPATVSLRGFELSGRTLGVVGLGRIGTHIAGLARAFGMTVIAHDPAPRAVGDVPLVSLEQLLASSDVVVLACSRRWDDPPLLGAAELASMRAGAVLVVVSRAAAADSAAVCDAVRSGHLRGYAVDDVVVDPGRDGDLVAQGRVVQTGHSAWWSDEVLERGAHQWVDSMVGLLTGGDVTLAVAPAGWRAPARRSSADPSAIDLRPGSARAVASTPR